MAKKVDQRPQDVASVDAVESVPRMSQPEFAQHVQALYPELVRYARRRLNRLYASAGRAADVAHTAIVDLLESGGYERCVTQDEVLAVLRTAIKHDAIDAFRDPERRHRSLHSLRDRRADHDEDGSNGVAPERPSAPMLAVRLEDTLIAALDVRRAIEAEAITTPKRAVFLIARQLLGNHRGVELLRLLHPLRDLGVEAFPEWRLSEFAVRESQPDDRALAGSQNHPVVGSRLRPFLGGVHGAHLPLDDILVKAVLSRHRGASCRQTTKALRTQTAEPTQRPGDAQITRLARVPPVW